MEEAKLPPHVTHVLYYRNDGMCRGSIRILQRIKSQPLHGLHLEDVHKLPGVLPPWLKGTPIVVDTRLKLAHKGSDAVLLVEKLVDQQHKHRVMMMAKRAERLAEKRTTPPADLFTIHEHEEEGEEQKEERGEPEIPAKYTDNRAPKVDDDALKRLVEQRQKQTRRMKPPGGKLQI